MKKMSNAKEQLDVASRVQSVVAVALGFLALLVRAFSCHVITYPQKVPDLMLPTPHLPSSPKTTSESLFFGKTRLLCRHVARRPAIHS